MLHDYIKNPRIKVILIALAIFIAIPIIIFTATTISRSGKIKVVINYEPDEAIVYLDNRNKNINHSTLYLSPGDYTFSAFLDGHYYQEQNLNINSYNSNVIGRLISFDASDEEIATYMAILDADIDEAYAEVDEMLTNRFPITNYLPYSTLDDTFYITYEFSPDYSDLTIDVHIEQPDDSIAFSASREILQSFDPDLSLADYNIKFHNYTNPFENQFQSNSETRPTQFLRTGFSSVPDFQVRSGQTSGDFYYTVLEKNFTIADSQSGTSLTDYVPYLALLKKQGDSWTLAGTPQPLLTTYNTPDVPPDVIDAANNYARSETDE